MANGTIAFDTLTTSDSVKSGTEKSIDTSYIFNGVAKVFVNYSGTGTTLEILLIVALQQTMEVEITQHLFQIICLMQIGVLQLELI